MTYAAELLTMTKNNGTIWGYKKKGERVKKKKQQWNQMDGFSKLIFHEVVRSN